MTPRRCHLLVGQPEGTHITTLIGVIGVIIGLLFCQIGEFLQRIPPWNFGVMELNEVFSFLLSERQRQWMSLTLFENPSHSSPPMGLTRSIIIGMHNILCETVGNDSFRI